MKVKDVFDIVNNIEAVTEGFQAFADEALPDDEDAELTDDQVSAFVDLRREMEYALTGVRL